MQSMESVPMLNLFVQQNTSLPLAELKFSSQVEHIIIQLFTSPSYQTKTLLDTSVRYK